jgi:O-antigen ligase
MLRQERIRFAPVYPLTASLLAMGMAMWYPASASILKVLWGTSSAIASFALIAIFALAGAALPEANFTEGWKYILYPSMDFLVFALSIPLSVVFASKVNWQVASGLALSALATSILIDARYPGTFSFLDTRAAGFGVNPNSGAALLVMTLIGVLDWQKPRLSLSATVWAGIVFVGVFMTMSRSGILLLGLVGMLYLRQCIRKNGLGTLVIIGGIGFCVAGYGVMAGEFARRVLPLLEANGSRANLFSGQMDAMDTREDSRVQLAMEHFEMAMERPFLGWGTGLSYSGEDGAHNMYLARWVENGVPGLLAYMLLIGAIFRIGWRHNSWECLTLAYYLAALSFFSHNLLEDKSLLIMLAITAGRAVQNTPQSSGPIAHR